MVVPAFVSGLLFGLSLIVAIGAQNAFVLRQGAMRSHVGIVVVICIGSDVLLIGAGVGGMGAMIRDHPAALAVVHAVGAALLLTYALLAARRVLSTPDDPETGLRSAGSRRAVVAASLVFTWLNPAVYLDVVLLGAVASTHPGSRWWFGGGAATASMSWFIALALGARLLESALNHRYGVRLLDAFVAAVMIAAALRIAPL